MVVNQKVTGTASSMPGGLAAGAVVSLVITLAGSVLSGILVSKEMIGESAIGYCALGILLLSSSLGAATAIGRIKHRKLMVCAMSGTLYYGMLLAMTALFFGGQYQGMGVTALAVFCGCMIVVLLGMRQGRGHASRRHKMARR